MQPVFGRVIVFLGCLWAGSVFAQSGQEIIQNVLQGALGSSERARVDRLDTQVNHDTVRFIISGDQYSSSPCGLVLYYGDGTRERFRVTSTSKFPREFTKRLQPGSYVAEVRGSQVDNAPACAGTATSSFTVAVQTKESSSSNTTSSSTRVCPRGWNKVFENAQTGAFTCAVAPVPLECGAGLVYFQDNGTVGCRLPRSTSSSRRDD